MSYVRIYPARTDWELVVLGDTQMTYAYPSTAQTARFQASIEWIRANAAARNIQLVLQMGDLSGQDVNTNATDAEQFGAIVTNMAPLVTAGIPWMSAPGNHDADNPTTGDFTTWLSYMPSSYFAAIQPATWGGAAPDGVGSYRLFTACGTNYVVVCLHVNPEHDAEFNWAKGIFNSYASRVGILVVHNYLQHDGTYATSCWDHIVTLTDQPNVRMILNGDDTVFHNSRVNGSTTVYQMLYGHDASDSYPAAGESIRVLHFNMTSGLVTVSCLTAYTGIWKTGDDHNFIWDLNA